MERIYFLKTERIGFSRWEEDDLGLAEELWGQPEVTRLICASGKFTKEEIEKWLKLEIENDEKYKVQYFPIFHLSDENLIGCCGLRPYKEQKGVFEIGFHLKPSYWRQGFGFEAASSMIHYGFSVLQASELKAGHHPDNTASKNLLKKLGFQYKEDEYYEPTGLYHPSYSLTL